MFKENEVKSQYTGLPELRIRLKYARPATAAADRLYIPGGRLEINVKSENLAGGLKERMNVPYLCGPWFKNFPRVPFSNDVHSGSQLAV